MNPRRLILSLERFGSALPGVVADMPEDDTRWRPPGGGWSILEIVTHMADEEVDDFRTRLQITLEGTSAPWPPIDPERWAIARGYNEGDLAKVLARFTAARRESVAWVRRLEQPEWSTTHEHPRSSLRPLRERRLRAPRRTHRAQSDREPAGVRARWGAHLSAQASWCAFRLRGVPPGIQAPQVSRLPRRTAPPR